MKTKGLYVDGSGQAHRSGIRGTVWQREAILRVLARRSCTKIYADIAAQFTSGILRDLLAQTGYKAGSEVKLKIDLELQLIPDVVATRGRVELPYTTTTLEVVIEILSAEDPMSRILTKCRIYESWGFEQIYVIDPDSRIVFRWTVHRLEEVDIFVSVPVDRVWSALDQALA